MIVIYLYFLTGHWPITRKVSKVNRQRLSRCECGLGEGFYHYELHSTHEYNPSVSEEQATDPIQANRKPLAKFFGHIDGRRVKLLVYLSSGSCNQGQKVEVSFFYKDYDNDRDRTFSAAANYILNHFQQAVLF